MHPVDGRVCDIAARGAARHKTRFSIEIYPPRTAAGREQLPRLLQEYDRLGVTHINITGKPFQNRETVALARAIKNSLPHAVLVPHLIALGLTAREGSEILSAFAELGIRNVFVVRGDIPADILADGEKKADGDFPHASDLVAYIKKNFPEFCIGVAGYPSGHYDEPNFFKDMRNLQTKVACGADYIVTQLFFVNEEFRDFVRRCELFGIRVPVVPGITQVKSAAHAEKLAALSQGSIMPSELLAGVCRASSDEEAARFGVRWLEGQVDDFIAHGAPLVHFYVFNVSAPFEAIIASRA